MSETVLQALKDQASMDLTLEELRELSGFCDWIVVMANAISESGEET